MRIPLLLLTVLAGATLAESAQGCRVFLLGDSITVQYRSFLQAHLPSDWSVDGKKDAAGSPPAAHDLDVPTGANGGDSAMVLRYLETRALRDPINADILVLNCGLHDIKSDPLTRKKQVQLSEYVANLAAILRVAKKMNLAVVWVRTTPVVEAVHNTPKMAFFRFENDVAAYNAAADRVMHEAGIPEIDLNGFTSPYIPAAYVDHVHYNPEMQDKQAAYVAYMLKAWWSDRNTRLETKSSR